LFLPKVVFARSQKRSSQYGSIDQPTFKLLEDRVAPFKFHAKKSRRSANWRSYKPIYLELLISKRRQKVSPLSNHYTTFALLMQGPNVAKNRRLLLKNRDSLQWCFPQRRSP
jgi:hypothetical protein